jgi:predicted GIY-YIG superfamily endonuclease
LSVDYIIKLEKKAKVSKSNKEIILLTPDCFKRLCLLSKTKKAEEVRTYFIELEKHIDKYKDVIIEKYIANHTSQQTEIKGGVIYLLNTDLNLPNVYKIGKTTDFKSRLKTHQSSTVDNIKVVKVYKTKDIDNVEKCLKQYLKEKQYKKYKEFYQVDKEIVKNHTNMILDQFKGFDEFGVILPDGSFNWNCYAYGNGGVNASSSILRLTKDSTVPSVNIIYPSGIINYGYSGQNISFNYSISDTNLQRCWYNYNGTNLTTPCLTNTSIILGTQKSIILYANDTLGNINSATSSWDYGIFENSVSYTTSTTIGTTSSFILNVSSNGASSVTSVFNYNGIEYSTSKVGSDSEMKFTNSIANNAAGTIPFYWTMNVGGTLTNTTFYNQSVGNLNLTNCSTGGKVMFNFKVYDEESKVKLNPVINNLTIEADLLFSSLSGASISNYSTKVLSINPLTICTSANFREIVTVGSSYSENNH